MEVYSTISKIIKHKLYIFKVKLCIIQVLHSNIITSILVRFYNTIITRNYYPKRWLQVLDVMLEKGKGAVIRKLQTIQLIEADLQLIMRIFIKNRENRSIENDFNMLQFNFRLRRNYSIEDALLEKQLIYD